MSLSNSDRTDLVTWDELDSELEQAAAKADFTEAVYPGVLAEHAADWVAERVELTDDEYQRVFDGIVQVVAGATRRQMGGLS